MTMKIYYINENICRELIPSISREQENKLIRLGITGIFIYSTMKATNLYAFDDISKSVQPLIDILIDLAEPVSYGFMVKGFLEWMSGKEHEGKKTIKASAGGYLGIQFIPQIFKIIKSIKLA